MKKTQMTVLLLTSFMSLSAFAEDQPIVMGFEAASAMGIARGLSINEKAIAANEKNYKATGNSKHLEEMSTRSTLRLGGTFALGAVGSDFLKRGRDVVQRRDSNETGSSRAADSTAGGLSAIAISEFQRSKASPSTTGRSVGVMALVGAGYAASNGNRKDAEAGVATVAGYIAADQGVALARKRIPPTEGIVSPRTGIWVSTIAAATLIADVTRLNALEKSGKLPPQAESTATEKKSAPAVHSRIVPESDETMAAPGR